MRLHLQFKLPAATRHILRGPIVSKEEGDLSPQASPIAMKLRFTFSSAYEIFFSMVVSRPSRIVSSLLPKERMPSVPATFRGIAGGG